ncbi:unnamed protein product, partial [marine sediment metagenome]
FGNSIVVPLVFDIANEVVKVLSGKKLKKCS